MTESPPLFWRERFVDITEDFRAAEITGMPLSPPGTSDWFRLTSLRIFVPTYGFPLSSSTDGQILMAPSYDLSEAVCSVDVRY